MRKVLMVSPHFDDAILSAGQFMADRPDTEVVTVFGGFPGKPARTHTEYDKKCGFKNALDAVAQRGRENDVATALLRATAINLPFPDGQYGIKVNTDKVTKELQKIIDGENYEFIMGPLGLEHPDHLKTNKALRQLKTELPIYFWEDLPIRVVEPDLVSSRIEKFGFTRDDLMAPATTDYKIARKIRSLLCYKSQIGTGILDPYVLYVPERFWRYQ